VLTVPTEAVDEVAARCFALGSCGLQSEEVPDGVRLRVYFGLEANIREVAPELATWLAREGLGHCQAQWEWEGERDWLRQWRAFYRPVWATPRIVVHPPFRGVGHCPGEARRRPGSGGGRR